MDKRMNLTDELGMANNGSTHQESRGQQFVCRVASSGLVQQFKVDNYRSPDATIQLQDVSSSEKQDAMDPLKNFEANCSDNGIPLLDQSESSKIEIRDEIHLLENASVAHSDQRVNRAARVDDSTVVLDPVVSLGSIVAETTVNETGSSENTKMDAMENSITKNSSAEDLEVRATEDGSDYGSEPHICNQCGKSFKEISSLNGHMGSHRREEYKCIRMMSKQIIPAEASHTEAARMLKYFWGPTRALVEMSMAHAWNPKYGTATVDLSASLTFSSDGHSSGETAEMREVAEFLTKLVERIHKETVTVPLPRSVEGFVLCTLCNKAFSSYQALGGHMSIHSKPKNSLLGDSTGSSSDSSERCTLKYECRKCNKSFPTKKSLGGHIRTHWREAFKMTSSADEKIWKPPTIPVPHETMQSSKPVVLTTDEGMQPPVLLASDNMQPTKMELGNDTEQPSSVPKVLGDKSGTIPSYLQ